MSTEHPSGLAPMPETSHSLLLVRRAQTGDRAALNELFERYYDRVYRIVRIRIGAKLRAVLESCDVVQETCLVATRKIGEFEPQEPSSIIQWLAAIAEHQIHDASKRYEAEKRDPAREVPIAGSMSEGADRLVATSSPGPSTIAANSELREIYDACVEALPEEQRNLVLQREYAGASWEAIAERLGKTNAHAAHEAYRRAQVKLAVLLRKRLRR